MRNQNTNTKKWIMAGALCLSLPLLGAAQTIERGFTQDGRFIEASPAQITLTPNGLVMGHGGWIQIVVRNKAGAVIFDDYLVGRPMDNPEVLTVASAYTAINRRISQIEKAGAMVKFNLGYFDSWPAEARKKHDQYGDYYWDPIRLFASNEPKLNDLETERAKEIRRPSVLIVGLDKIVLQSSGVTMGHGGKIDVYAYDEYGRLVFTEEAIGRAKDAKDDLLVKNAINAFENRIFEIKNRTPEVVINTKYFHYEYNKYVLDPEKIFTLPGESLAKP